MKEIKIKAGLRYLLMKVYRHFSGDLIFHLMESCSCCRLGNGKELINHLLNIVLSCTEKVS